MYTALNFNNISFIKKLFKNKQLKFEWRKK